MKTGAKGFSLVELLVVVALVSLLMGIVATSLDGIFQASGVSESVLQLDTDLSLARQASSVTNRSYEIRFLKFADPDGGNNEMAYRGYQVVIFDPETAPDAEGYQTLGDGDADPATREADRVRKLPGGVVCVEDATRSPLLEDPSRAPESAMVEIGDGVEAEYRYFRFSPDGGTDLSHDQRWYVTITHEGAAERGEFSNYATLEIEPSTGKLIWHRP